jgi:signal transduction histidine kinase
VGAVVYDTRINGDVSLVEAAAAVIAIAVDRERLTADLLASRAALRSSTARLVDAGDRERRRIAQDLHDGLQADLILLALQAGRLDPPEAAADLRIRLDTAAADLRAIVHGLMPALLVERGLYAAVEELADRLPIATSVSTAGPAPELGSPVESLAYLATAEALANAVKHSSASSIAVDLSRRPDLLVVDVRDDGVGGARPGVGAGLTGIADRVAVLGGLMRLESHAGRGTRLVLELPCAS